MVSYTCTLPPKSISGEKKKGKENSYHNTTTSARSRRKNQKRSNQLAADYELVVVLIQHIVLLSLLEGMPLCLFPVERIESLGLEQSVDLGPDQAGKDLFGDGVVLGGPVAFFVLLVLSSGFESGSASNELREGRDQGTSRGDDR